MSGIGLRSPLNAAVLPWLGPLGNLILLHAGTPEKKIEGMNQLLYLNRVCVLVYEKIKQTCEFPLWSISVGFSFNN